MVIFRADEEELLDNDISYEFHRESHHIHSIPRTEIGQVIFFRITQIVRRQDELHLCRGLGIKSVRFA
jgi:hypothetical protein